MDSNQENITVEPIKSKKKWIFSGLIAIILFIVAFFVYQNYEEKQQAKNLKELRILSKENSEIAKSMMLTALPAETMLSEISSTWHDAIYVDYYKIDGSYVSDFQQALEIRHMQYLQDGKIVFLEKRIAEMEESLKKIKDLPEELKGDYDLLYNIYKGIKPLAELAITPEGNLGSFNEKVSKLESEISAAHDEYEIKGSKPEDFIDKK